MTRTKGSVAVMTGCASGIGAALGKAMLDRGYRLVLTDIDAAGLTRNFGQYEGESVILADLDIRDENAWRKVLDTAFERWNRLDILLNVAGYLEPAYSHECEPEQIARHMRINAEGPMLGTRLAAERMVAQGNGHIINIASLAGVAPVPGLSMYVASKFALRGFSLAVAQELREHGVYVTVICPDAVQTPMLDMQVDYPQAALTFSGGRVLTTEDIVDVILDRAIPRKPLEILVPGSRGFLARIASFFPGVTFLLGDRLTRKGRRRQEALASTRDGRG